MNILCRPNNDNCLTTTPHYVTTSSSKCCLAHLPPDDESVTSHLLTFPADAGILSKSKGEFPSCSDNVQPKELGKHADQNRVLLSLKDDMKDPKLIKQTSPKKDRSCATPFSPQELANNNSRLDDSCSSNLSLSPLAREFREMRKIMEQLKNCCALNFNPLEITPSSKLVSTSQASTTSRESASGTSSPLATNKVVVAADNFDDSNINVSEGGTDGDSTITDKDGSKKNEQLHLQLLQGHRRRHQQKIAIAKLADEETRIQVEARLEMLRNKKAARIAKAKAKGLL